MEETRPVPGIGEGFLENDSQRPHCHFQMHLQYFPEIPVCGTYEQQYEESTFEI